MQLRNDSGGKVGGDCNAAAAAEMMLGISSLATAAV
jgi:predicted NBD/HSP70 family sugar kinase